MLTATLRVVATPHQLPHDDRAMRRMCEPQHDPPPPHIRRAPPLARQPWRPTALVSSCARKALDDMKKVAISVSEPQGTEREPGKPTIEASGNNELDQFTTTGKPPMSLNSEFRERILQTHALLLPPCSGVEGGVNRTTRSCAYIMAALNHVGVGTTRARDARMRKRHRGALYLSFAVVGPASQRRDAAHRTLAMKRPPGARWQSKRCAVNPQLGLHTLQDKAGARLGILNRKGRAAVATAKPATTKQGLTSRS